MEKFVNEGVQALFFFVIEFTCCCNAVKLKKDGIKA